MLLVKYGGVNVQAIDKDGNNAIKLAELNKHIEIQNYLSAHLGISETVALLPSGIKGVATTCDGKSKATSSESTPATGSLSNDSETVRTKESILENQKPIVVAANSLARSNGTSKSLLSKYFAQFRPFLKGQKRA